MVRECWGWFVSLWFFLVVVSCFLFLCVVLRVVGEPAVVFL